MEVLYVALGAAVGGVSRWAINKLLYQTLPFFPLATLTVNIISSFFAGIFISILLYKHPDNTIIRPLLITGFCGGFSTMSSLSLESLEILSQGKLCLGMLNFILNITLCLLATWAGTLCVKGLSI